MSYGYYLCTMFIAKSSICEHNFQKKMNEILFYFFKCAILHNNFGGKTVVTSCKQNVWRESKQTTIQIVIFLSWYQIYSIYECFFSLFLPHRPNVCTERKEELSDWNSSTASSTEKEEEGEVRESTSTSISGGFHFSFNTCVEKANKRTCKTV